MKSAALALALAGSVLGQEDWDFNPWTLPANSLAALRTTVTSKIKTTVTVCPCLETSTTVATAPHYSVTGGHAQDSSSAVESTKASSVESVKTTSAGWAPSWSASSSESDVTKTVEISKYTTICPVTETHVSSGTTYTKTYSTVSTVTSSISIPVTYSHSASLTTETGYSTFTSLCTTQYDGTTTVETHTHSKPVYTTKTCTESAGTNSASASKTGSVMTAPYPTSSASNTFVSGTAISGTAISGTVVSGTVISGTGSASVPSSSGASKSSSAPVTSPTGECKRCEGQPGDDEFCGYTIKDNYYKVVPNTCRTVEYDFTVTDSIISPDGISRPALIVNNQMPGPKIEASWGDWIKVTVHNQMKVNGSSIHFHGMRQNHTNEMDGVPSITQCPLAPGETQTYKFRANSYGTSWWHSHFALQTYEGVFGPIVVHGPIDEETSYSGEQVIMLQDWSHATVDELFHASEVVTAGARGGAPTLDTGLINGLNVWGADGSAGQSGKRFEMTVTKGQTYRLRLVNSAIASTFKFFIDGHKFKVIASEAPYPTSSASNTFVSGTAISGTAISGTVVSGTVISGTGSASVPSSSGASKSSSAPVTSPTGECKRCEGQPGDDEFCGYTIKDNYYKVVPNTCRTVEYDFTVTDSIISPDGISRPALIVNNQMPGPKIEASWGDWIKVTVHNQMKVNGSSIHFHGMRQNHTNEMDGVPSITQCPLAPGETQTYKFRANSYGTSWWHSHFALQTYEGVFGPIVVHGPIDEETSYSGEQVIMLQDWSHATVDELFHASEVVTAGARGGAPTLDTGLINGLNVWGADGSAGQSGKRFEMTVTKGQTYRLRLVNSAIASTFKFFIDGHKFKVIASDFVPIQPYETDILNINIGQRYDILVTFDQAVGNYWMRSDNQAACNTIVQQGNIKGVVRYAGASDALPTSTAYTYTDECVDEPIASLVPIVALDAGASTQTVDETVVIGANGGNPNLFKWTLSGTSFQTQWGAPTLQQIYENGTAPDYRGSIAIDVPTLGEWVYVIIDTPIPVTHPIHLHGHDFMILAQGTGLYTNQPLNTKNPARRDVVNMPAGRGVGGYVVIAFQADNPGAWLLHCHIGWHVAMGFALQIIENLDGIKDTITDPDMLTDTCTAWNKYSTANNIFAAPWESGV
nr:laccase-2 [Quercus suber]